MPGISKPRNPATPAKGSSPVAAPGGSTRKPSRFRPAPQPVRPQTVSPLARQMMQRELRRRAAQPQAPANRAPGVSSVLPAPPPARPTPQMQTRAAPTPIGQTPTVPQTGVNPALAQMAANAQAVMNTPNVGPSIAYDPTPGPSYNARGLFGPEGRLAEANRAINAPATDTYAPPGQNQNDIDAAGRYGYNVAPPPGAGVRDNLDGSQDWIATGPNGQPVYTPKTRQRPPTVVEKIKRGIGQGLAMGLEAFSLPAKAGERALGAIGQVTGGAEVTGRVLLPDGTFYTPPTGIDPARQAQNNAWDGTRRFGPEAVATTPQTINGRPITNPAQAAGLTEGAVQVLTRLFPDTAERSNALNEITRIAYSPGTSQVRAGIRMIQFGQHPDFALYGDGAYVTEHLVALGYLDDKLKAIKADPLANYVYESWKADGFTDDEFINVLETQGLPGEQYAPSEMLGQALLDPLNIVGEITKPMLEADRVARATTLFGTQSLRTAEEIAAGMARGWDTGLPLVDKLGNFIFGRTPTAVRNQVVTAGADALSASLRFADEGAKGSRFNVLKAVYDFAAAAPTRLEGQSDEAFALAQAAWRSNRQLAQSILENKAPVMLSDAGKLGGALVRKMLQGQDGTLSTKLLTEIATSDKAPYQIMGELMGKLDEAATALLMPERSGARNVAEFVANTGKPAQAYPIFERGIAGAGERVAAEKAAQAAGLDYKASPLAHALAGFDSLRSRINSKLWAVFANLSPAYSGKNFFSNFVGAVADGNMSYESMGDIENLLHIIGDPSAAFKGIGSGEVASKAAKPLAGGFSGYMRSGDLPLIGKPLKRLGVDIPLGAQAVEEMFSKRIVYAAAKRFLDRQMVLGKAIPELPASLLTVLGDDVARQMVQHIAARYGDVDGALRLAEQLRGGVSELWRIPADEHLAAVREFGGDLAQKLDALLTGDEYKTADGIRAAFARLRRETAEQLQVAERNIPSLTALTGEVGEAYAEDIKIATEAGVDVARLTGEAPAPPATATATNATTAPLTFEQKLAAEQNAQAVAQGRAFEALKANPDRAGFDAFAEVQTRVTEGGRATSARLKELRQAAWDQTKHYRSMEVKGDPEWRARMVDEVWRDYFARRDQLWSQYRQRAIELWDGITVAAGSELTSVPDLAQTAKAFEPTPWTGKPKVDYRNEKAWLQSQLDQLAQDSPEAQRLLIRINELAADPKLYFRQYGYQGAPIIKAAEVEAIDNAAVLADLAPDVPTPRISIPRKWTPSDPRSILSTLNSLEADALNRLGQTRPVNMDDAQWQLLQDWLQAARAQTQQARVIAGQVGTEARNFTLLNYGDKRNFDMALGVTHPYHYWYGRTYANWMKRAVLNPGALANYARYRQALDTMHAALPEYYRQQLSTDDLGLDMETPLMFNLEQTLSPLYGVLGTDFTDPVRRRAQLFGMQGFGAYVEDAGALGPTPWAPIAWATALSSYAAGDRDAGNAWLNNYLGTLPRAVRAVTASAGIGGPGGVNLDPQMFTANLMSGGGPALNSMTQWERQRVATILAGYGDNVPQGTDPLDWQAQVEEAAYTQSGPLWDKAMQEMFVGTAPAVLTSFFAGLGFKGRSETEAEVSQIYAEVAKIRANYGNWTPERIQQEYINLQERHPMYELLMLSRAQGAQRDDAWVWEAMGRVGIGDREAWAAAGVSEAALDAFFSAKTTENMNPDLLKELLDGANAINARNRPVSLEEQQRQLDAKIAYDAIKKQLEQTFAGTGAFELEDEFFRIRDENGPQVANDWMENLEPTRQALLRGLLDAQTEAKMNAGPDVQRYFIDPERYEAMLVGQYYDEAEVKRPGIQQLSSDYWDLRDSGDYGAAAMLLKEHPELKEYWDETAAFKNGVRQEVLAWLKTLPASDQGAERADFDPANQAQTNLDAYYQQQDAAQSGVYDSPYGQSDGQPTGAVSSTADAYRQRYEAEQAAKLAAQEGRQTYLNNENKLAYTDNFVLPLYHGLGDDPVALATMLDTPIAQDWPATTAGVPGLLKMLGEAESVREGLFAYASEKGNADWVRYVALLRNMDDAQLSALVRKYPQLSDAAIVAQQAREYDRPTQNALHDILGFTVSISEDGYVSISRQSVKKDKKKGTYGLTTQGDDGTASGGGFGGSSTSRRTYARFGGGGGGGGGDAPDPAAEQMATWINFALTLKDSQPDLLRMLMDFFDMTDEYGRDAILARYPQLAAYLQSLGAEKLAQLADAYYSWRQDQADAQAPVKNGKKQAGPQIIRYYRQRPATSGLQ